MTPRLVGRPDLIEKRILRIRNRKADELAAWLNPTRSAPPFQLPSTVLEPEALAVKLPNGVESIVPIPQQNVIHAFGSSAGLDELQKILDVVDKPLRQFEVTLRVIQIEKRDLAKLFADPKLAENQEGAATETRGVRVVSDWSQQINALQAAGKAKVLAEPHLTTSDGLPTSIKQTTGRKTEVRPKEPEADTELTQALSGVETPLLASIGMEYRATATQQGHGTIAVEVAITRDLSITIGEDAQSTLVTPDGLVAQKAVTASTTTTVPLAILGQIKSTVYLTSGASLLLSHRPVKS